MSKPYLPATTTPELDGLYEEAPTGVFFQTPEGAALAFAYANGSAKPDEQLTATQIAERVNERFPNAEQPLTKLTVGKIVKHPEKVLAGIRDAWVQQQAVEKASAATVALERRTEAVIREPVPVASAETEPKRFIGRNPLLSRVMLETMGLTAHMRNDKQGEELAHQAMVKVSGRTDYENPMVTLYEAPGRLLRGVQDLMTTTSQTAAQLATAAYDTAMEIDKAGQETVNRCKETAQSISKPLVDRARRVEKTWGKPGNWRDRASLQPPPNHRVSADQDNPKQIGDDNATFWRSYYCTSFQAFPRFFPLSSLW